MKFAQVAAISLASVASAEQLDKRYYTSVYCSDPITKTVTEYVTLGAGGAPPAHYQTSATGTYAPNYTPAQSTGGSGAGSWIASGIGYSNPPVASNTAYSDYPSAGSTGSATYLYPPPAGSTGSATYSAPPSARTYEVELRADLINNKTVVHYVPDRVDAALGDVIKFKFHSTAHSATQSSFDKPCTHLDDGFDSDLIPNPMNLNGTQFERLFTVEKTTPLWFYCKQPVKNHCGQGMVFGINPAGKMDQFIANAIAQNGALVNGNATSTSAPSAATSTGSSASSTVSAAAVATPTVVVSGGMGKPLQFNPPFLSAAKGSSIVFDFRKLNHTLTESTFEAPCTKKVGTTIDTNFHNFNMNDVPLQNATTLVVDSEGPRYFYCKQANGTPQGHCSAGMVFALNVDAERFGKFQANAKATLPAPKGRRGVSFAG